MKLEENQLPKGWEVKKLGEVCKLKNGFAFKSNNYQKNDVPVIRISDISSGIVSSEDAVRVEARDDYENYLVETNDILVAMSGATTGKFGIFKSTEKAYQNQRVGKFKILDEKILNNQFLFYQINSLKKQIEKDSYGGAQPNISSVKIEQMEIPLPPLPEQQAIVAKIEELFSQLENGKKELLTAQAKLKTYRQSLLNSAFEGRLTNENLKDKELPEGWEVKKLGEVCEIQTGKYDANHAKPNGKYRFYTCAFESMFCDTNRFNGESIILPGNGANVGEVFYYDGEFDAYQRTYVLNGFLGVLPKFLYHHLLCYWKGRNQDKQFGSATNYIRIGNFTEYEIPVPPLAQQQQIVAILESKLAARDQTEETIKTSLNNCEILRQSILKKAFEGRLVNQNFTNLSSQ